MKLKTILSTLFLAVSALTTATAMAVHPPCNRTFIMNAVGTHNASILGKPLVVSPPEGVVDLGVGFPNSVRAVVFIYKGNIYRKCKTSPTRACLGMLTKAYAGALTGWYFDFSEDEKPRTLGPYPPITGGFAVKVIDHVNERTGKKERIKVLAHSSDANGQNGSDFWTLCDAGPGAFEVNSAPIPPFAHNGPRCTNQGIRFKIKYHPK